MTNHTYREYTITINSSKNRSSNHSPLIDCDISHTSSFLLNRVSSIHRSLNALDFLPYLHNFNWKWHLPPDIVIRICEYIHFGGMPKYMNFKLKRAFTTPEGTRALICFTLYIILHCMNFKRFLLFNHSISLKSFIRL